MNCHYSSSYFSQPPHAISINLVGCGGTGSQVLNGLARINYAMQALGHPGLHVNAFDGDIISENNIGRQLFSLADIDQNKANVLVTRINRFFGQGWNSIPAPFNLNNVKQLGHANIVISCVDSVKARLLINEVLKAVPAGRDETMPLYWMDFGNSHRSGQVVLGTLSPIKQPESKLTTFEQLPTVFEQFPEMATMEDIDEGPSCSIAQALGRQDLFINSTLAQVGCAILWKLLTEPRIVDRGAYLSLENLSVRPIKIGSN